MKYGVFSRSKRERTISGDAYTVQEGPDDTLFALVDGLGSGEEAARAAQLAIDCVQENRDLLLIEILRLCHQALRYTRGAVMGLLRVEMAARTVRYVGVGNIGIRTVCREPFRPISYNGIVGYRLPQVHEFVGPYDPGDLFVLYSDGIDNRFHSDEGLLARTGESPRSLAENIARHYGKDDDICVLVAR